MAENRVIGKDNKLPWHFKADLQKFKALTMGQTLIMGRKTFESIGKPLPGRENFVLSRAGGKEKHGLRFFQSLDDALKAVQTEHAFIIGGAEAFRQSIERIDGIYLTLIHQPFEGDVSYPEIPPSFREASRERLQEDPRLDFVYYRKSV